MGSSKYTIAVIGGGVAILALLAALAKTVISAHGTGNGFGAGALVGVVIILIFLGLILGPMVLVALVILRRIRRKKAEDEIKVIATTPTTAATVPNTPPPPAPTPKKKHGVGYWIMATLVWAILIGAISVVGFALKHCIFASGPISNGPINWSWPGQTLAPPDIGLNCPGVEDLDKNHAEDHSRDDMDQPVYIKTVPAPGSEKALCWSARVTLPPYQAEWHPKFLDPNQVKGGCLAYVQYQGISRIYGPYRGTVDIGESNMPHNDWFRVATNCSIYVYGN